MRVTLKKIADIAKVSRGTVDKVLNNRPGVSDDVRKKIVEIANALEYKPNIIGKALANQKKPYVIGVIIPPDTNPFFNEIKNGINFAEQELKDFGLTIDCQIMKSLDPKEQLSMMDYLAEKEVSALALAAIDHPMICEAIDKMVDGKIPVVTFNSDIIGSKRFCFVGQDLVKSGRVAGELMGKILQGKGQVAIITGSRQILAHNQRIEGFKTIMENEFPEIEIVAITENQDRDTVSFEQTLALLEKHPGLNGIYITAGGVSGVGKAVKFTGKGHLIKIISFDFVPETVELVKEGIIDFTIGQDPFTQGYKPVKILSDYLFYGQSPVADFFQTKVEIRIKENIDIPLV